MKITHAPPGHMHEAERKLRVMDDNVHDPYQLRGKVRDPMVCTECKALFRAGRWQWGVAPAASHHMVCPACRRIRDRFPAGYVTIEGDYAREHRPELLKIVRNHEAHEKAEHPYQRIMNIEESHDRVLISTTDIHLARGIGDALHSAHRGELKYHYEKGQYLLRVHWTR
jgi:hypothetical protein